MPLQRRLYPVPMVFACALLLAGCTGFDRFMDHPVLSWLPLDHWGVVAQRDVSQTHVTSAEFPDRDCFEIAQERTEVLNPSQFDAATLRTIFADIYRNCTASAR